MEEARLIVRATPSGQVRVRVRLQQQRTPPGAAAGGALSRHQNLQIDETTGEVTRKPPVLKLEAKRLIREYSAAIERAYGREHCIFLTGTLPGSTVEALREFAACQKTIQRRLRQWLVDCTGSDVAAVFVWEYQKRGALHLHVLIGTPSAAKLRTVRRRFKRYWISLLGRLSDASGVDLFASHDGKSHRTTPRTVRAWAQTVRKSVSAYLAKYLSKSFVGSAPPVVTPISRLWGATAVARGLSRQFTNGVQTVAVKSSLAVQVIKDIEASLAAAAVPIFTWRRRASTIESTVLACGSSSTQGGIVSAIVHLISCSGIAFQVEFQPQTTEQTPLLTYLEGVCAFFGGRAIVPD